MPFLTSSNKWNFTGLEAISNFWYNCQTQDSEEWIWLNPAIRIRNSSSCTLSSQLPIGSRWLSASHKYKWVCFLCWNMFHNLAPWSDEVQVVKHIDCVWINTSHWNPSQSFWLVLFLGSCHVDKLNVQELLNVRPSSLSGKEFEHGRLAMEQRIICNLPLEANIGKYSEKFLCGAVEKTNPIRMGVYLGSVWICFYINHNIARVRNCPDITILFVLLSYLLFVF